MFLALLVFAYQTISSQETNLIDRTVQDSVRASEVIKAAIRNRMMTKQRGIVRQIVNAMGSTEGFKEINIYDQRGALYYSSIPIQSQIPKDISHDSLLKDLKTNSNIRHEISDDGAVISVVNPLLNTKSCSATDCHAHPEVDKILGAIELKIALRKIRKEISQNSYKTIVFAIALFLIILHH